MAINATRLANEIAKQLRMYEESVREEVNLSAEEVGKQLVKDLKQVRKFKNPSKIYPSGWAVKRIGKRKIRQIVHNKKEYQLTHLLEKGHAKRGGGRRVPAYEHIKPLEEKAVEEFINRVERALEE